MVSQWFSNVPMLNLRWAAVSKTVHTPFLLMVRCGNAAMVPKGFIQNKIFG